MTFFSKRLRDLSHYFHYYPYCKLTDFQNLLSQFFWKEQFDTFDNGCDFLRAAFCDSRDVFHLMVLKMRVNAAICSTIDQKNFQVYFVIMKCQKKLLYSTTQHWFLLIKPNNCYYLKSLSFDIKRTLFYPNSVPNCFTLWLFVKWNNALEGLCSVSLSFTFIHAYSYCGLFNTS